MRASWCAMLDVLTFRQLRQWSPPVRQALQRRLERSRRLLHEEAGTSSERFCFGPQRKPDLVRIKFSLRPLDRSLNTMDSAMSRRSSLRPSSTTSNRPRVTSLTRCSTASTPIRNLPCDLSFSLKPRFRRLLLRASVLANVKPDARVAHQETFCRWRRLSA